MIFFSIQNGRTCDKILWVFSAFSLAITKESQLGGPGGPGALEWVCRVYI